MNTVHLSYTSNPKGGPQSKKNIYEPLCILCLKIDNSNMQNLLVLKPNLCGISTSYSRYWNSRRVLHSPLRSLQVKLLRTNVTEKIQQQRYKMQQGYVDEVLSNKMQFFWKKEKRCINKKPRSIMKVKLEFSGFGKKNKQKALCTYMKLWCLRSASLWKQRRRGFKYLQSKMVYLRNK